MFKNKNFLEQLEKDGTIQDYLVCEVDGKIVGIAQFLRSQNSNYLDYGLLGTLYVLKKYQGLGIGKELFKRCVRGLMLMGYNKMYLECLCGNKTIDFYKKYGGKLMEVIDYSISDFSVKADIVCYNSLEDLIDLLK